MATPWAPVARPCRRPRSTSSFAGSRGLRFSWYLEFADGPFWSWHRVPAGGTRFNFLTQAGTGFLIPAGEGWSVLAGYRWVHVSNANLGDRNPSWNYHALVLGVRHPKDGRRRGA